MRAASSPSVEGMARGGYARLPNDAELPLGAGSAVMVVDVHPVPVRDAGSTYGAQLVNLPGSLVTD